jgi:hypothetical protein
VGGAKSLPLFGQGAVGVRREAVTPQRVIESTKREKTISLGGRSHRIANDHHALLSELNEQFRYFSMEELLFFTSLIGARIIQTCGLVTMFNVQPRR